jgi:PAS domain-containing protein
MNFAFTSRSGFRARAPNTGTMNRYVTPQPWLAASPPATEDLLTTGHDHAAIVEAALDALDDHVAVLDADGTILVTNRAWDRFAEDNGGRDAGVGANYLGACEGASGEGVATALRDLIAGRRESFLHLYDCHSPSQERWFVLNATRHSVAAPRMWSSSTRTSAIAFRSSVKRSSGRSSSTSSMRRSSPRTLAAR